MRTKLQYAKLALATGIVLAVPAALTGCDTKKASTEQTTTTRTETPTETTKTTETVEKAVETTPK